MTSTVIWKNSKTELPEEGVTVLIHNKFWDASVTTIGWVDTGRWFYEHDCSACMPPPTHWCEFPSPPAEEAENNKAEVPIPGLDLPPRTTTNAISPRTGV